MFGVPSKDAGIVAGVVLLVGALGFIVAGKPGGVSALFAGGCVLAYLMLSLVAMAAMHSGNRFGAAIMALALIARIGGLGFVLWFCSARGLFSSAVERLWFFIAGGCAIAAWIGSLLLARPSAQELRAQGGYLPRADWETLV
ncbi:MAG: hypothetical protein LBJ43_04610 [Propionibacteriaceae bacterium]|jgi:hypothetical protein|nr:hypothetical protein [Propionibacteriaceae bacterium]